MKKIVVYIIIAISAFGQNGALFLDGQGDYLQLPQPIIDSDVFTIEAWFQMYDDGGDEAQQRNIFCQRSDLIECNSSIIVLNAKAINESLKSAFTVRSEQECSDIVTAPFSSVGEWHHLVAVKTANEISLDTDGQFGAITSIAQEGSYDSGIDHIDIGRHTWEGISRGYSLG